MKRINVLQSRILSDLYYLLKQDIFEYFRSDGSSQIVKRIVFDRGNGAAVLLIDRARKTVILTKQFRYPTRTDLFDGMMIEVCAGLLDEDNPEECIIREAMEETGYNIENVKKIMEIHPSPGAVTEILHLFIAEYTPETKQTEGGGLIEEGEDIEVLEFSFDKAFDMIQSGEITDAKTIILLQYAKLYLNL